MTGSYGKNRLFLSFSVIQNIQNNEIKTPEFSSENRGYHRVRLEGLEPSTNGLKEHCSPIENLQSLSYHKFYRAIGRIVRYVVGVSAHPTKFI